MGAGGGEHMDNRRRVQSHAIGIASLRDVGRRS